MSSELLERRFAAIGARLRVDEPWVGHPAIDVGRDRDGEFFDVSFAGGGGRVELEVVDVALADRHLLLLARDGDWKSKFLCGHDERHWFSQPCPSWHAASRASRRPSRPCNRISCETPCAGSARRIRTGAAARRTSTGRVVLRA